MYKDLTKEQAVHLKIDIPDILIAATASAHLSIATLNTPFFRNSIFTFIPNTTSLRQPLPEYPERGGGEALQYHHVHHHKETFVTKYIFSQDHKTIAKQFLITGIVWAIIGGLFSVLFRLQLGYPDQTFPWLESILGSWAKGGRIQAEAYYALVTMHGTVLVFFVLTAGLSGTFSNFLIPLQIGARDMASPLLNMLSYWFFFIASIIMLASLFVQTGPFSGGWTAYPPLSALGSASPGSKTGMDLWIASMALFVVSSLLGGLNYISTVLNMRTKGMSMTRLPLTIWAFSLLQYWVYFPFRFYYLALYCLFLIDILERVFIYRIYM